MQAVAPDEVEEPLSELEVVPVQLQQWRRVAVEVAGAVLRGDGDDVHVIGYVSQARDGRGS